MESGGHRKPDTVHGDTAADIHGFGRDTLRRQVFRYLVDSDRLLPEFYGHAQVVCMGVRHGDDIGVYRERTPGDKGVDENRPRSLKTETCVA